jgi:RNA polymerase sigma factor (sigma-70 family)
VQIRRNAYFAIHEAPQSEVSGAAAAAEEAHMAADAMLLEPIATFPVSQASAPAAVRHRGVATAPSWRPAGRVKLTDEQLSRLVRRVGDQALAMLYARHHGAIERFCLGLLRHREDAAEAAQDAWVRACSVLLDGRADVVRFRPWLYAIARNACVDRARERRRVEATEPADLDLPGAPSADEALAARDEVRGLLADLALLSERQRSALLLRDVAGLSPVEAGEALGTTAERVTWLAADARRSLEERRAGRDLGCDAVRDDLQGRRVGNRRLRAHLDQCAACRSFERGRRGRALSARCFGPIWMLRPAAERLLALFGGGDGPCALAKPLAAGTAAIALAAGGHAATQRDGRRPPPAPPRVVVASAPAIAVTAPQAIAKPAARTRPARGGAAAAALHVVATHRRSAPRVAVVAPPAAPAVPGPAAAPAVHFPAAPPPGHPSSPAAASATTATVARAVAPVTAVAGSVGQVATRAVAVTTGLRIGAGSSLVRPGGP